MENSVVFDVLDYVRGDCKLTQAVLKHLQIPGLGLLPAAQMGTPEELGEAQLRKIFKKLAKHFDYVLVDAPAGLTRGLNTILDCVENTLLVVTPDDVSIRDAERIVTLCREHDKPAPMIVVNRVIPALVQSGDMYTPQTVADTLDVPLLGFVPDDTAVLKALNRHQTVMEEGLPGPLRCGAHRQTPDGLRRAHAGCRAPPKRKNRIGGNANAEVNSHDERQPPVQGAF